MEHPLVSVCCIVYNHEKYLHDCLDGILMQKTSFDYEIIIHDDASTDSSADIIRDYYAKYPSIIKPFFQSENQFSQGVPICATFLYPRAKGKYIAICEGDDYWIDPNKLQKQVDFLELHYDYGFVGSYNNVLWPDGRIAFDPCEYLPKPVVENGWELYGSVIDYAKFGPVTRTLTLCFRKSIIDPYMEFIIGDLVLGTILAEVSNFAKLQDVTAIYRKNVGISSIKHGFERRIAYNHWFVQNRLMQKKLFPNDCDWDEDELRDRETFLWFKHYIFQNDWKNAIESKKLLKSTKYKKKKSSRMVNGPISCCILCVIYRIKGNLL